MSNFLFTVSVFIKCNRLLYWLAVLPYRLSRNLLKAFSFFKNVKNIYITHPLKDIYPGVSDIDFAVKIQKKHNFNEILFVVKVINLFNYFYRLLDMKSLLIFSDNDLDFLQNNRGFYMGSIYPVETWTPCFNNQMLKSNRTNDELLDNEVFNHFQRKVFVPAVNQIVSNNLRTEVKAFEKLCRSFFLDTNFDDKIDEFRNVNFLTNNAVVDRCFLLNLYLDSFNSLIDKNVFVYNKSFDTRCIFNDQDIQIFKIPNPFEEILNEDIEHFEYFVISRKIDLSLIVKIRNLVPHDYKRLILLPNICAIDFYFKHYLSYVPTQIGYYCEPSSKDLKYTISIDIFIEKTSRFYTDQLLSKINPSEIRKKCFKLLAYDLYLKHELLFYSTDCFERGRIFVESAYPRTITRIIYDETFKPKHSDFIFLYEYLVFPNGQ